MADQPGALRDQAEAEAHSLAEARIKALLTAAADLHDAYSEKELLAIIAACLLDEKSRG